MRSFLHQVSSCAAILLSEYIYEAGAIQELRTTALMCFLSEQSLISMHAFQNDPVTASSATAHQGVLCRLYSQGAR